MAERWIGGCRRELLDQVIVLHEAHLRRLIRDYISNYHEGRIQNSLGKGSPATRVVSNKPDSTANLISFPRVGGLHHRYDWQRPPEPISESKRTVSRVLTINSAVTDTTGPTSFETSPCP
jgi:hypothetical protein